MSDRPSHDPKQDTDLPPAQILVIDDEEVVHQSLQRILGRRGHQIRSASSAADGLAALETGRFDMVITDLMMPEMNGIELLEALQQRKIRLPVLMITGYPTIKTALQAMRLGAVDYLAKPFTRGELLAPVERALRREGDAAVPVPGANGALDGLAEPAVTLRPGDRFHLPQHSWAEFQQDGTMRVGVEPGFLSGVGEVAEWQLPAPGDRVEQGHPGLHLRGADGQEHALFMPFSGEIVEVRAPSLQDPSAAGSRWCLRLLPSRLEVELGLVIREGSPIR